MAILKCKFCDFKTDDVEELSLHIEKKHADTIPPGMDAFQFIYFLRTGKNHGTCVMCKGDTEWNHRTRKYSRFCTDPKCKEKYTKEFNKRMIGKYGKIRLLDDPEHQRKMLKARSISGTYVWSDGTPKDYTGTYELSFLKFLDMVLDFDSSDVMSPSPHTYYYIYEGKQHFYIPDVYIPSLNLEIEIKDGGNNVNTHHKIQAVDKVKEKLKDEVMSSNKNNFNYIKIVDKQNAKLFKYLEIAKEQSMQGIDKPIIMI